MKRCVFLFGISSMLLNMAKAEEAGMDISADDFKNMTGMDAEGFMKSHNENAGKEGGQGQRRRRRRAA